MLRILRKATTSSSKTGRSIPDAVVDDLSVWEFVDPSQSDDDIYSFDDEDSSIDEPREEEDEEEEESSLDADEVTSPDDVMSLQSLSVSPPVAFPVEVTCHILQFDDGNGHDHGDDAVRDDGDEDDDDDAYADDVDDELVPWKLKGKFGKQRIRKMGKRGGPKPGKSKRLPYHHNRPGCLYGKHGLGVQHSYI